MKANEAQESDMWMMDRCGMFTASRSADLMAKTKSGPSTSRANLLTLLAVERLTGQPVETYQNDAMRRGTELEAEARDAYSFHVGAAIVETGFIRCQLSPNAGCSPDGLLGADGMVEIKCPASMQRHLSYLTKSEHATEYRWQLQHQMMVTGRAWNDVVSFDPRFPDGLRLAITRVFRDDAAIATLRAEILAADSEVESIVAQLKQMVTA